MSYDYCFKEIKTKYDLDLFMQLGGNIEKLKKEGRLKIRSKNVKTKGDF